MKPPMQEPASAEGLSLPRGMCLSSLELNNESVFGVGTQESLLFLFHWHFQVSFSNLQMWQVEVDSHLELRNAKEVSVATVPN